MKFGKRILRLDGLNLAPNLLSNTLTHPIAQFVVADIHTRLRGCSELDSDVHKISWLDIFININSILAHVSSVLVLKMHISGPDTVTIISESPGFLKLRPCLDFLLVRNGLFNQLRFVISIISFMQLQN